MYSVTEVKSYACRLRDALDNLGRQVKHSQCLEVISKIEGFPDWNTYTAAISNNQQRAEQFLDEMLEAEVELNYRGFTRRFEEKYLVGSTEQQFLRDMRNIREDHGHYVRREFLGCIRGKKHLDNDRYPNLVRYVWRGIFEKNEVLITVGIYQKDGLHYVSEARYR